MSRRFRVINNDREVARTARPCYRARQDSIGNGIGIGIRGDGADVRTRRVCCIACGCSYTSPKAFLSFFFFFLIDIVPFTSSHVFRRLECIFSPRAAVRVAAWCNFCSLKEDKNILPGCMEITHFFFCTFSVWNSWNSWYLIVAGINCLAEYFWFYIDFILIRNLDLRLILSCFKVFRLEFLANRTRLFILRSCKSRTVRRRRNSGRSRESAARRRLR